MMKIISRPVYLAIYRNCEWSCAPLCLVCGGSAMIRFLILAGYFWAHHVPAIIHKLNQYINLHYSYLAYISMFLSFVLALVQLIIWVKQMKIHSHLSGFWAKVASIFLLCIPLFVGLFFPTVTLDSPNSFCQRLPLPGCGWIFQGNPAGRRTTTQYLKPDTSSYFTKSAYESEMKQAAKKYVDKKVIQVTTENYMEVMEVIYDYPDQFAGKTIELTGLYTMIPITGQPISRSLGSSTVSQIPASTVS